MASTDPTPADFTSDQPAISDDRVVESLTAYARRLTPEEVERQTRRAYPPHRLPGTDERRRSQAGEQVEDPIRVEMEEALDRLGRWLEENL